VYKNVVTAAVCCSLPDCDERRRVLHQKFIATRRLAVDRLDQNLPLGYTANNVSRYFPICRIRPTQNVVD